MAQHDYNIANQSGADFRADLNNALSAIATVNSGASEPSTTFAHQLWVDTTNNVLKIRNAANSAFITTGLSITASNTFAGNLTGNVTGDLTGNADTATTLATARTINGVSFNGSANISFNTDSVAEGSSNLYFTNERVDDRVDDLLVAGTGISLNYDDTAGTLTIANTNDADITGVLAGNALTGGGTSGDVTLNVAVDDSSIEIDSDALRIKASGITNTMLAGSIANTKLANSSVTINSQSLSLGGSLDLDTDDIGEGSSNLYYTTARVNSDFDTRLGTKDTGDLTEGSNLYYTDARVNSAFDTRLSTKDTDDVAEGTTNLYYTSARANTDFDTRLATKSTTNVAEGANLYYTTARFDSAFTSKDTDDLSEGTTNLYYTQSRFDSAFGNKTTANLTENTNLYYTDTRANSAIDARVVKSFVDALNIQAASVDANSVTLGTDTTGNYIQTITGTANKITVSGSGSESADVTLTLPDDVQIADSLTVAGNLTVNGTLTSLDTTNLDIEDNLFQLNAGLTGSPVNDSGMLINRGTADNGIFMWDESVDKFTMGLTTADGSATGNITLNSLGTLVVNVEGNVTGNVTGTVSSLSNHDTADLTEGSNLYYTSARANTDFDTRLATKDTGDLSEGSNLYYTDARVQAVSINNVVEDTTPQLGGDLASNGNDILFDDSDKAIFGTGSDLQIYHDGGNSYISEVGNGSLIIKADDFELQNATGTEKMIRAFTDSTVQLYHNNASKLSTTSTGIDVTGTATMDGLILEPNTSIYQTDASISNYSSSNGVYINGNASGWLRLNGDGTGRTRLDLFGGTSGSANFVTGNANRLNIAANGDISFYDDTGTSQALFWDASAERLGIGTTSPTFSTINSVSSGIKGIEIHNNGADTASALRLGGDNGSGSKSFAQIGHSGANFTTHFAHYNTSGTKTGEIVLGATGNVGINTVSPNRDLSVAGIISAQTAANNASILLLPDASANVIYSRAGDASTNALPLVFKMGDTERMRIDSSGNVGLGTSVIPTYWSGYAALQLGVDNSIFGNTATGVNSALFIGQNLHNDGSDYKYTGDQSNEGSLIDMRNGTFSFLNAPAGTGTATVTNRMTITSSGNVGIGTASPSNYYANKLVVSAGYADGISIAASATTDVNYLMFADTTTSIGQGWMGYYHNGNALTFGSNSSERMRIDSSGNVLVGKTVASVSTAGAELRADGQISSTRSGDTPVFINRLTNDGRLIDLRKDGSTVGSIGTVTQSGATNIVLDSNSAVYFDTNARPKTDNTYDLGSGTYGWKDLYLSGTANVGDITINGSTISDGGSLTIDAGIDLTLDAESGNIFLKDGGTHFGTLQNNSSDLRIVSIVQDKDLILRGNDGGSYINALTLDMSDAGSAIFNGNVTIDGFTSEKYLTLRSGFAPEDSGGVGLRAANHAASNRDGLAIYGHDGVSILTGQTERMRITSSGTLGFGMQPLGTNSGSAFFNGNVSSKDGFMSTGSDLTLLQPSAGNSIFVRDNGNESMRIDSSGNLGLGTTGAVYSGGEKMSILATGTEGLGIQTTTASKQCLGLYNSDAGGTRHYVKFAIGAGGTQVGSITSTGTTTAYNTSSDGRLKDVTGSARGLEVINELNPVSYNWKESGQADEGLIAQEVLDIVPNSVSGSEEDMYQMDYSKLVVHLVAGMKEQQEQIEELQSQINKLKGE